MPNIHFLMSDEHRADILGYAGNPVIRTPNLDRLAKDGGGIQQCVYTIANLHPRSASNYVGSFPQALWC